MSSNLNWLDNKVVNPGMNSSRQTSRATYAPPSDTAVNRMTPEPELQRPDLVQRPEMIHNADMPPRSDGLMNSTPPYLQGPPPSTEKGYIPYFLSSNIGKIIRAEFIIGNSQYFDKVGRLVEVGFNYFVLDDINFNQMIMCDLYSVKFVTILRL